MGGTQRWASQPNGVSTEGQGRFRSGGGEVKVTPTEPDTDDRLYCPFCGEKGPLRGDNYCAYCGSELTGVF